MPISAKEWYEPNPDLSSFYQGDVVKDVPIIFLPDKISQWFILRPNTRGAKLLDDVLSGEICRWFEAFPEGSLSDKWQLGKREEFVAANARLMNAMILTQSCDLVSRGYYQVVPVYPESELKQKNVPHLRENNLNYAFYLPAFSPHIPENSYGDLSHATLVPKRYFPKDTVKNKLAARLTALAMTKLQEQIAEYFGRPFGFGEKDRARSTSEYACISCFYRRAKLTKRQFEEGSNFAECTICGDTRWLRVVPAEQPSQPNTEPVLRNASKESDST